ADYLKAWTQAQEAAVELVRQEVRPQAPLPANIKEEEHDEHEAPGELVAALAGRHMPWLKWAVPAAAACMLFIVNIGSSAKPAPPPAHVVEPVEEKRVVPERKTGSLKVTSTPSG